MKRYWSILWRYYLCAFLVSRVCETFFYMTDADFIKLNLTMNILFHGAFFYAASLIRTHKFSQGFWRDLYDEKQLKIIYSSFIFGAVAMSMLSLLVAISFSTDAWVGFKLFGMLFYVLLIPVVAKFRVER